MKYLSLYRGTGVVCEGGIKSLGIAERLFTGYADTFITPDRTPKMRNEHYVLTFSDNVSIKCSFDTHFSVDGWLMSVDDLDDGMTIQHVEKPEFGKITKCEIGDMFDFGVAVGTVIMLCDQEIRGTGAYKCFNTVTDVLRQTGFDSGQSKLFLDVLGSDNVNNVVLSDTFLFQYNFDERSKLFAGVLKSGVLSGTKDILEIRCDNKSLLSGVVVLGRSVGYSCSCFENCIVIHSNPKIYVKTVEKYAGDLCCSLIRDNKYPIILENYVKVY